MERTTVSEETEMSRGSEERSAVAVTPGSDEAQVQGLPAGAPQDSSAELPAPSPAAERGPYRTVIACTSSAEEIPTLEHEA